MIDIGQVRPKCLNCGDGVFNWSGELNFETDLTCGKCGEVGNLEKFLTPVEVESIREKLLEIATDNISKSLKL